MRLTYQQAHYLPRLHAELLAAIPGLRSVPAANPPPGVTDALVPMMTISGDGATVVLDVPDATVPAEVEAVLAVHSPTPPPLVFKYAATTEVSAIARTTDATALEVLRLTLGQKRIYQASLTVSGIDAGNGSTKIMDGRFVFKRLLGSAVMVGITVVSDIHDAGAAAWAPNAVASGNDIVFTVAGAAGRTIDWLLVGAVGMYAPAGVAT